MDPKSGPRWSHDSAAAEAGVRAREALHARLGAGHREEPTRRRARIPHSRMVDSRFAQEITFNPLVSISMPPDLTWVTTDLRSLMQLLILVVFDLIPMSVFSIRVAVASISFNLTSILLVRRSNSPKLTVAIGPNRPEKPPENSNSILPATVTSRMPPTKVSPMFSTW